MFKYCVIAIITAFLALIVGSILRAQVLTSQPYVCMATVDSTYAVPAWQKVYAVTGAHCPISGQLWVISGTDDKGTLYLVGGPK